MAIITEGVGQLSQLALACVSVNSSVGISSAGLLGEGAVQVLYSTDEYKTDPILAAVGQLQFEVS